MQSSMLKYLPIVAALIGLSACVDSNVNGSNSGGSNTTVNGVAATGAPISGGTVSLSCGNGFGTSTTTASNGQWSATVPSSALPCNVKVYGGTPAGTFYSVAQRPSGTATTTTANITPLTDLATAAAVNSAEGRQALEVWFANDSPALRQQVADGIAAATAQLRTALNDAGYDLPSGSFDPFTAAIVAGGAEDLYDQILEAYKAALAAAGKDYGEARDDYNAGADLPQNQTTLPPSGPTLPDDKLGVSFDDASTSHLWLQPAGQGGISAINGNGDGQVIAGMGDRTENGPDGTVSFNILPNKLGTYACGDAVGNGKMHMQLTFQGITNPRKSYISYEDAADPAQRKLLPGFSCSVTLTHVGTFTSQYIYGDGYIEGTFTAKLRQASPDCVGEGNCSTYKELTVTRGKFRINKSGTYTPVAPATSSGLFGKSLKSIYAGNYTLKCAPSVGQATETFSFAIAADGGSTLNGAPLVDSTHPGTIESSGGEASSPITLGFYAATGDKNYVVLGFKSDGTFQPNSLHITNGATTRTLMCYFTSGNVAPAAASDAVSDLKNVAATQARSETLNCRNVSEGADVKTPTSFSINSDGSAQIGGLSFAAKTISEMKDGVLFANSSASNKSASISYSVVENYQVIRSLSLGLGSDMKTTGVIYSSGDVTVPSNTHTCTPQ